MPSIRRNLRQIGHRAACPICALATYSIEFCEFQSLSWILLSAWNTHFWYLHRICHGLSDAIFIRFPIRISLTMDHFSEVVHFARICSKSGTGPLVRFARLRRIVLNSTSFSRCPGLFVFVWRQPFLDICIKSAAAQSDAIFNSFP